MIAVKVAVLLAACVLAPAAPSDSSNTQFSEDSMSLPRPETDEDVGYLNSIMDWYRGGQGPEPEPQPPQPPQRYRPWKRNANIISTLLGFPRRLLLAGR